MKKSFLALTSLFLIASVFGQKPAIELTFTAIDNTAYVKLDSIKVMNRTLGVDTVLYYPDTVLVLDYGVGIPGGNDQLSGFRVFQNFPNPVIDQSLITVFIPGKGDVKFSVTDLAGRQILSKEQILDKGYHSFRFIPGSGSLFLLTAQWNGKTSSIKMMCPGSRVNPSCSLEYTGGSAQPGKIKSIEATQKFIFNAGDELLYIGYSGSLQSGIVDSPAASETFVFQYATNIPCPGMPTVTYEDQVYNTIQIFSQCWLKENLNVGTMIPGSQQMSNDNIIEKYCYDDDPANCNIYGGLYQWDEVIQYNLQNVQGICPPGWHVSGDEEWNVLEGSVDSQYGIGDPVWDTYYSRGYDAGFNLKSSSGWYDPGNGVDLVGFSGLPGGGSNENGSFGSIGTNGGWWTAKEHSSATARYHYLDAYSSMAYRSADTKLYGLSVRCIKE